jgi:hypothetical protein
VYAIIIMWLILDIVLNNSRNPNPKIILPPDWCFWKTSHGTSWHELQLPPSSSRLRIRSTRVEIPVSVLEKSKPYDRPTTKIKAWRRSLLTITIMLYGLLCDCVAFFSCTHERAKPKKLFLKNIKYSAKFRTT